MIEGAKRSNEDRESQLREQVNTALQKVGHLQEYAAIWCEQSDKRYLAHSYLTPHTHTLLAARCARMLENGVEASAGAPYTFRGLQDGHQGLEQGLSTLSSLPLPPPPLLSPLFLPLPCPALMLLGARLRSLDEGQSCAGAHQACNRNALCVVVSCRFMPQQGPSVLSAFKVPPPSLPYPPSPLPCPHPLPLQSLQVHAYANMEERLEQDRLEEILKM